MSPDYNPHYLYHRRGEPWSDPQPPYGRTPEQIQHDWRDNHSRGAIEGPFPISFRFYRNGVCVAAWEIGG